MARDRLAEDLRTRILSLVEAGDPRPILDAAVPGLARDLAGILNQDAQDGAAPDALALSVLVALHTIRHQLLPEGQNQDDLRAYRTWSARFPMLTAGPLERVPAQAHLAQVGGPSGDAAADANRRGNELAREYQRAWNKQHLDSAIDHFRQAVTTASTGHPYRAMYMSNLGEALRTRFELTGQPGDLDEAVAWGREAVTSTPSDHPDRPQRLNNLEAALLARFQRSRHQPDLNKAITLGRQVLDAASTDNPDRAMYLSNLGSALGTRFGLTGQPDDLDEAIALSRQAVKAARPGHPNRPGYLSNLARALNTHFELTGQPDDLDEAITLFRQAVTTMPTDHPSRPEYLSSLQAALHARFKRAGHRPDLDEALNAAREALSITATTPADPKRASHLSNLAGALFTRFQQTGYRPDLDEAITLGHQAIDATPPDHADRPEFLSNLATELRVRFERTGHGPDLDEAINTGREAVTITPPAHPERAAYLSNLGATLVARFERTGERLDLDEAITLDRQAVDATPATHPHRPDYQTSLGIALLTRFKQTGQQLDSDEAITRFQDAVAVIPTDHLDRPRMLSNLGVALANRFERTGQQPDLKKAIAASRRAVDATPPDHPDRPAYLSNLGTVLRTRFERNKYWPDLDEAITLGRQALSATPPDHPDRPAYLYNLGIELRTRFEHTGHRPDLDEAITLGRQAISATPPDHPDQAMYLLNLGVVLRARFERTGHRRDLDEAIGAFRQGAEVATASPRLRLSAAQEWGRWAMEAGDPGAGLEGYTLAVEHLLPLLVWHGLDQATREHHLATTSANLASAAAACAAAAGDPRRAVELLEAGRAVLWAQVLQVRSDLSRLAERSLDLAAALERARAVLDHPGAGERRNELSDGDTTISMDEVLAAEQSGLEARRKAARDWDLALKQVRDLEGFEHFLRPTPFAELRRAATDGPVVILNSTVSGCHVLIVTPNADSGTGVQMLKLPAVTYEAVAIQANTLLKAEQASRDPARLFLDRESDRATVFAVLAWLWDEVASPILEALGHTATPRGPVEDWPRLWWCPVGPFAVLPIHAAGRHPRTLPQYNAMGEDAATRDSVAGRVVSSYAPTLAALSRARSAVGSVRQLAVGLPETPGRRPLPAVPDELRVLDHYLPRPDRATHLCGPAATRTAVMNQLTSHSWLHISCHGVQDPTDASRSAFVLHDGPLSLADLAALDLQRADLAYLAACQTAANDVRLPDETLHLAAALQVVGYRHVLATLWDISDAAAPVMADTVYARLTSNGHPHASHAAAALHHAMTTLRQACPGDPIIWAPYIHLGP